MAELRKRNITNIRKTEFFQGRTTRWGIAWSFTTEGMEKKEVECILVSIEFQEPKSPKLGKSEFRIKCEHPKEFLHHVESILGKQEIIFKSDYSSFSLQVFLLPS